MHSSVLKFIMLSAGMHAMHCTVRKLCAVLWNCDVQRVLQSIQNTADKPQPSGSGTNKQTDVNDCQNSVANHVNKGNVCTNSQTVVNECDTTSSPSSASQNEMLVFYCDVCLKFKSIWCQEWHLVCENPSQQSLLSTIWSIWEVF